MLIPRYADRLEAIGPIGIKRCYLYTLSTKSPLFTPETLRPTSVESIMEESRRRYPLYKGNSLSMVHTGTFNQLKHSLYSFLNVEK